MSITSQSQKLDLLRRWMQKSDIDVYLIPDNDPHQSEYLASFWQSRAWLSGFDGSTGMLVVTEYVAHLWTDSRYFIQAEQQLKATPFVLQKAKKGIWQEIVEWLIAFVPTNQVIGLDGELFSVRAIESLQNQLTTHLIKTDIDLIAKIWQERPLLPRHPVFARPSQFNGIPFEEKIKMIRSEALVNHQVDYYCCSTLDDIAWTLNLRGRDIEFNPVFLAYLVIDAESTYLFINQGKVEEKLAQKLEKGGVKILSYEDLYPFFDHHLSDGKKILLHKGSVNYKLAQSVKAENIKWSLNIIEQLKAIKNSAEIDSAKKTMIYDGIVLVKLMLWLERMVNESPVNEYDIAQKLILLRSEFESYIGESFPAIVGYESNGAIVHYRPSPKTASVIKPQGILLLDTGGQYLEGTTDITRTFALGKPNIEQIKHFTLVLKGHIALAMAKFPIGTMGVQLDTLARIALWKAGLNFGHGTGHGVGSFLNVHEGPQSISPRLSSNTPITPGMITSNEPGFYLEGAYGIRIENLVLCKEMEQTSFGTFLGFETLSLFPLDFELIDQNLLNEEEIDWLNDYHQKVFATLSPSLNEHEREWLKEKCKVI